MLCKRVIFTFLLAVLCMSSAAASTGSSISNLGLAADFDASELTSRGIYDFITASKEGRTIGEMILDIEGAPDSAYDTLEYAVFTAAYAIRPQDDEITALRKVDSILFDLMHFRREPGTSFTDALINGKLDCSDATIVFISAAERAGRDWKAVIVPFHMFVAARDGAGYVFWETQESRTLDLNDLVKFHGLRRELVEDGVYLNAMTVRHHIAETYRSIGGGLVRDNEPLKALGFLDKSLWLWPEHPPTIIWHGYANGIAGDFESAEADYLHAIDIDPYDWVANYHLAALYTELGETQLAAKYSTLSELYRPPNAQWVLDEALPYLCGE
jgi:tetratricopeptide (TPR) repeat protein